MERYKEFSISANPPCLLYLKSTKRLTAYQFHGNLTPGSFSTGCSHCLRRITHKKRFNARTVTEQEYHCPYCLSSLYREPSDTCSRLFIAPCRAVCSADRGAAANVANAFAMAIGMCLMNGYSVVKEHAYSPHKWDCSTTYSTIFLIFSSAAEIELTTAEVEHLSISAIRLYVNPRK